jgi:hypothetical protein
MILLLKRSVLAGCYKAGRAKLDVMFDHYVTECPILIGRYRRVPGETLCGRVKPDCLADVGSFDTPICVDCAKKARALEARFPDVVIDDEEQDVRSFRPC